MIRISFSEPTSTDWKDWCVRCDLETQAVIQSVEGGQKPTFSSSLYTEQKRNVYALKEGPFHGKCVYCEEEFSLAKKCDIEHFRPKGKVTNATDVEVMIIDESGQEVAHPGYYWLAYDWKNLLPSCADCNRAENTSDGIKLGKRNRFPVEGDHAIKPGGEKEEDPLLLNPVYDDPKDHIDIDENGTLHARNDSKKGGMTIEVLGLNRDFLIRSRQKAYEDARELLYKFAGAAVFGSEKKKRDAQETAKNIMLGNHPYSAAARCGLNEAKKDIHEFLGPNLQ